MRKQLPVEFIYQVFSLIIAIIIVQSIYVTVIRPNARQILKHQAMEINTNPNYVPKRSTYIIIKDYEQESCIILMLWCFALMGYKAWLGMQERKIFQMDLLPVTEGTSILPEDTREYSRPIQALPESQQGYLLPRALLTALHRFRATRNIQDVSNAVRAICESESERLDSELSMIRYIAWAIPSIGFLGTVRGIGQALGEANKAVQGDIAGVTQNLGIAFNSTFVALVISIVVMFLMHQLQLAQERRVLDAEHYCDTHLIRHLQSS